MSRHKHKQIFFFLADSVMWFVLLGLLFAVVSAQTDECRFRIGANTYDLTPLKNRTYVVPNTRYIAYTEYIAVCGDVLTDVSGCVSSAAICEKDPVSLTGLALGFYPVTFSESQSSLVMKYSTGRLCFNSTILFTCDANVNEDPVYSSETECDFFFTWRTKYACPVVVSDDVPNKLIDLALSESLALSRFTEVTNKYGNRLSATTELEKSIDWVLDKMISEDKFDHVYTENVKISADGVSRNIIAELRGSTYPNQFVVMGGHINSWDALDDDGSGAFVAWDALRLMAKYNHRPKRTIRVVFWTNEENGANGAKQYKENREAELPSVSWAFESGAGVFNPSGIRFTGSEAAFDILKKIGATYLTRINAGEVVRGSSGTDIEPMCLTGVPCSGLNGRREDKTDSHTKADMVTALRANEVALRTASMAAWTYAVADLDILLPRN